MGAVGEITVLFKFSCKRENKLDSLIKNVEGVKENETVSDKGESMNKLCAGARRLEERVFKRSLLIGKSVS